MSKHDLISVTQQSFKINAIILSFYRCGEIKLDGLSHLPKITELINNGAELRYRWDDLSQGLIVHSFLRIAKL